MKILMFCLLVFLLASTRSDAASISIDRGNGGVSISIRGEVEGGRQDQIFLSEDLRRWFIEAVEEREHWTLDVSDLVARGSRFVRVLTTTPPDVTLDDDGFNSFSLEEALASRYSENPWLNCENGACFIKFTVLFDDLARVYFQDSGKYPFHYEFGVDKLPPFAGYDRERFGEETLDSSKQKAIVGAVLLSPYGDDYGIRFEGEGEYSREMVRYLYELVDAAISDKEQARGFYLPAPSQKRVADEERDYFESVGIPLGSIADFSQQADCYVSGWAVGRLRYVEYERVEEAYESGELLPTDILVTDDVPAELPYVAGILSLQPATPNSHVALLARSYGVPFSYVSGTSDVSKILSLLDEEVFLGIGSNCQVEVIPAAGFVDDAVWSALVELTGSGNLEIPAKKSFGSFSADVASLTPADIVCFGGKASNFGFLLREIPANTRPFAVAFSFDLWDEFLDQEIEAGIELRTWIDEQLSGFAWPEVDVASLNVALRSIRDKIEDVADFNPEQRSKVLEALSSFEPSRKIRFRSSTNVEDAEDFTGAGLYDSKSGCLADELDDDADGPSLCDPGEGDERGVFRAMRKVYASFYNSNAYLERLRRGIDESEVGMGLLAHYSYPDEIELANGVLVFEGNRQRGSVEIVSQVGAESVTNPAPEIQPESVTVWSSGTVSLTSQSGLLPIGQKWVLANEDRYRELYALVEEVVLAYADYHEIGDEEIFSLDFEYKLVDPGLLEIKQVRRLPSSGSEVRAIAFLGGESKTVAYSAEGGQGADGGVPLTRESLSYHYLKSDLVLRFDSLVFESETSPQDPLIREMEWTHVKEGSVVTWSGDPMELPDVTVEDVDGIRYYRWTDTDEGELTRYEMQQVLPDGRGWLGLPFVFASDVQVKLTVEFPEPRLASYVDGVARHGDRFEVYTRHINPDDPGFIQKVELLEPTADGVSLSSRFYLDTESYWTKLPIRWDATTIGGLASEDIVLTSEFAQTFTPFHHNWGGEFVFEPRLDPGVPERIKSELEALDIMRILVGSFGYDPDLQEISQVAYVGFDGQVRTSVAKP